MPHSYSVFYIFWHTLDVTAERKGIHFKFSKELLHFILQNVKYECSTGGALSIYFTSQLLVILQNGKYYIHTQK